MTAQNNKKDKYVIRGEVYEKRHYRMLSEELLSWDQRSIICFLPLWFWFLRKRWLLLGRWLWRQRWWSLGDSDGVDHGWRGLHVRGWQHREPWWTRHELSNMAWTRGDIVWHRTHGT